MWTGPMLGSTPVRSLMMQERKAAQLISLSKVSLTWNYILPFLCHNLSTVSAFALLDQKEIHILYIESVSVQDILEANFIFCKSAQ